MKQIQFPLVPEYLGYTDAGLEADFFTATRPAIEILDEHVFKYRVDFENMKVTDRTAAFCVSRPTNPTGNVLTDDEIRQLDAIAGENDIPLIIDGAYGTPFPNIILMKSVRTGVRAPYYCLVYPSLGCQVCVPDLSWRMKRSFRPMRMPIPFSIWHAVMLARLLPVDYFRIGRCLSSARISSCRIIVSALLQPWIGLLNPWMICLCMFINRKAQFFSGYGSRIYRYPRSGF